MNKVRTTLASDKMHSIVAQVLNHAAGKIKTFNVKQYVVRPGYLSQVARYVIDKRIKVVTIEGKSDFDAGYVGSGYILLEPWGKVKKGGGAAWYRSLMVHEAVHAAFDIQGQNKSYDMSAIDDESAAYIAQAMYLHHQGFLATDFLSLEEPVQVARRPALEVLNSGRSNPPKEMLDDLQDTLKVWYKNQIRKKDGI